MFADKENRETSSGPRLKSILRAFRHRDFRVLWSALLFSSIGTWMQIVAQSLLVLCLTHGSAFALGCVSLSQASAFFLFALLGGSLADRVDRRRLLIATQTGLMILAAVLGVLTTSGIVTVPIIAATAFLSGVMLSFDQPARSALVSTLVPSQDLVNAVSLQSAVFNIAAIVGPALAGVVVSHLGLAAAFFLNALSFIGMLLALTFLARKPAPPLFRENQVDQIYQAFRLVRGDRLLASALSSYGIILFAGPSLQLLLPVLALNRLHTGPGWLGLLFSGAGIGAVIGALLPGSFQTASVRPAQLAIGCWCAALALAGTGLNVGITFVALVVLGASQSVVAATTAALLQSRVLPHQRGRVMGLNTLLLMGVRPLGDFPAGALISAMGASFCAIASATVVAAVSVIVYTRPRGYRSVV